ncbi:MAG: hypothetical protein WAP74_03875 [Patescibacteria group bacterium]
MVRKIISALLSAALLALSTPVGAQKPALELNADGAQVVALGKATDPKSGKQVEGYAIVHYRTGAAKPSGAKGGGTPSCFTYLAKGAKWKTIEPWITNPTNTRGLAGDFVLTNLTGDIAKWEDAADGVVGNGLGINILGDGSSTTTTLVADTSSPDNQNEVYFADVSQSGAIAVTIVWGIFSGPILNRVLVEWDQVYDDVDFDWSASGEAGKMDFENIGTHELGHSVGMGDLYESVCSEQTMFGFAATGETKKRTLEGGDIKGVDGLY